MSGEIFYNNEKGMTVGDLKNIISGMPDEMLIVLSKYGIGDCEAVCDTAKILDFCRFNDFTVTPHFPTEGQSFRIGDQPDIPCKKCLLLKALS